MLFLGTIVATLLVLQAPDSSIAGVVTDAETGAELPGAVLSITGSNLTSTTAADGSYLLAGLLPGSNEVLVVRPHYYPRSFRALVPDHGSVRIDIALRREPTSLPAIEVRAERPPGGEAGDGAASVDHRVTTAAMRSDPLLAEPDPLVALGGGEVVLDPESPRGVHVFGGASDQVAYRLDGVPVFSPYHGSGTFSAWNPDALAHLDLINAPGSAFADGLSGTVSAVTITPASRAETRGSVSTTQARSTLDGPLGWADATYVVSLRSTFPGLLVHQDESTYVEGSSSDWLVKLESSLAGGRLRMLGYKSDNGISASAASTDSLTPNRNQFLWKGGSIGAGWSRRIAEADVQLGLWSASVEAGARWAGTSLSIDRLDSRRHDIGLEASIDIGQSGDRTSLRLRGGRAATYYRILQAASDNVVDLNAQIWSIGLTRERHVGARGTLAVDLGAELWRGALHADPGAEFQWRLAENVSFAAAYSHRHQFAQSLRNEESVVGGIFPADLFVDAGPGGVPVASSDLGVATLAYRPAAGVRLTGRAYLRSLGGLALVPPRSDGPYADPAGFVVGRGRGAGIGLEASATGKGYNVLVSYGLQRMRLQFADSSYVPGFSVTHSLQAGARLLPFEGTSINIGVIALSGRHGTAVTGPFEWENCNLLDRGCEFAGNPRQVQGTAALLNLPAYIRLDVGIRKRWLVHVARRDAELALFGTLSNVLDRHNVMTAVVDPRTGAQSQVEMRPRAPLTLGLDWRY